MVPISRAAEGLGATTVVTGLMADQIFYRALEFLVEDIARGRFRSLWSGLPWLSGYPWKTRVDVLVKMLRAVVGVSLRRLGLRRQGTRVGKRPWWLSPETWSAFVHEGRSQADDGRRRPEIERALVRSIRTMQVPGEVLHRQEMLARRRGLLLGTPFLDRDVMELALCLPNHVMQSGGWPKGLLRKAASTLLPSQVVWREGRTSFDSLFTVGEITRAVGSPMGRWSLYEAGLLVGGALDNIVEKAHTQWDYRSLLARLASAELFVRRF